MNSYNLQSWLIWLDESKAKSLLNKYDSAAFWLIRLNIFGWFDRLANIFGSG